MLFQNSTTGLGAGNGFFLGIGDNEASYVWNYHNEPVIWATNNTERMRLSNTGDVSIGTSGNQTGSKLNVYGAIGSAVILGLHVLNMAKAQAVLTLP